MIKRTGKTSGKLRTTRSGSTGDFSRSDYVAHRNTAADIRSTKTKTFRFGRAKSAFSAMDFQVLAGRWEKETSHISSLAKRRKHPAYKELKRLGRPIIPLAIGRLKTKSPFWFLLLEEIAPNPPKDISYDNLYEAKKAWIAWSRHNGYATS